MLNTPTSKRYARCVEVSKRIRWEIERDVIRGRDFDFSKKFLPDGLSLVRELPFLTRPDRKYFSQIQGRTYANIFGLVERFIGAKVLEISQDHWLGDQIALEALVRFTDEELKHQALFRRIETMMAAGMPVGYRFLPEPNDVARAVLGKSTWAVLGLTCNIELFTQQHYRQSIDTDRELSDLWRDVVLYHWREEAQHAVLDELEWQREHAKLGAAERNAAVDDLIQLVAAVDAILQVQAVADTDYFFCHCAGTYTAEQGRQVGDLMLRAYRWQYIASGVQVPRFSNLLGRMLTSEQMTRVGSALAPLLH
jgi:hypothetical protein